MRVLLVAHGYPPYGVAGVERLSAQTAVTLVERGHEVTVFARRRSGAPPEPRIEQYRRENVRMMMVVGGDPPGDMLDAHSTFEQLFERCLLEVNPDVVLISHLMHHSPLYVFIAHRWHVPVVVELHDFFFACPRAHLERTNGSQCSGPEGGARARATAIQVRMSSGDGLSEHICFAERSWRLTLWCARPSLLLTISDKTWISNDHMRFWAMESISRCQCPQRRQIAP